MDEKGELLVEFEEEGFEKTVRKADVLIFFCLLVFEFLFIAAKLFYNRGPIPGEGLPFVLGMILMGIFMFWFLKACFPKKRNIQVFTKGILVLDSDAKIPYMLDEDFFVSFEKVKDIKRTESGHLKLSFSSVRSFRFHPSGHEDQIMEAYTNFKAMSQEERTESTKS